MAKLSPARKGMIEGLRNDLIQAYSRTTFIHHEWYVRYHLEIVEKIAIELAGKYHDADQDLVLALVWLHDYGKTIDPQNQYQLTLTEGRKKLIAAGFDDSFTNNRMKALKDWNKKIVLPEACAAFEGRFRLVLEQCGEMPSRFL
jgi:hypothetical protein